MDRLQGGRFGGRTHTTQLLRDPTYESVVQGPKMRAVLLFPTRHWPG
jgi:hypothetical protein